MLFASWLAQIEHLSPQTITVYLSAVRSYHIDHGYQDPLANQLRLPRLLKGIKRLMIARPSPRMPVTKEILHVIYSSLDLTNPDHLMFWAACTLAFYGFLRVSEFTTNSAFDPSKHLTLEDVAVDSTLHPSSLRLTVKSSKCDQFRQGASIYIGRGNQPFCALASLLTYLHQRGATPGPLFRWSSGQPLTSRDVNTHLRRILK